MAFLGQEIEPKGQRTLGAPRRLKDFIEEELFTSTRFVYRSGPRLFRYHLLYFGGRSHNKDHRPDLNQMVVGMAFGRRGSTNLLRDVAVQHSRCQDSPTGS
jgi:hypothetical protein